MYDPGRTKSESCGDKELGRGCWGWETTSPTSDGLDEFQRALPILLRPGARDAVSDSGKAVITNCSGPQRRVELGSRVYSIVACAAGRLPHLYRNVDKIKVSSQGFAISGTPASAHRGRRHGFRSANCGSRPTPAFATAARPEQGARRGPPRGRERVPAPCPRTGLVPYHIKSPGLPPSCQCQRVIRYLKPLQNTPLRTQRACLGALANHTARFPKRESSTRLWPTRRAVRTQVQRSATDSAQSPGRHHRGFPRTSSPPAQRLRGEQPRRPHKRACYVMGADRPRAEGGCLVALRFAPGWWGTSRGCQRCDPRDRQSW